MKVYRFFFAIALGALAVACSKSEGPKPEPTPATATAAATAATPAPGSGQEVFASRCSVCHGTSGHGDGVGAAALNPKPRNYTDKEWQKTVTDEDLKKVIVQGGAAVGKSAAMPPNPDLASKPQVVDELVAIVRGFGK